MSFASSTTNLPAQNFESINWVVGQSPVGTVLTYSIPVTEFEPDIALSFPYNLSAGVWSISPVFVITSSNDDMLLTDIIIKITGTATTSFIQNFYYGADNDVLDDLTFTQSTSATIYVADDEVNPVTTTLTTLYTATTNASISGYIQYVRIA
jgi:hypothetical protein